MKVVPNGGLNCSILDGWWDEAYDKDVGFAITSSAKPVNQDHQDEIDNNAVLNLLLNEIIPIYFDRNDKGVPNAWVGKMKSAYKKCTPMFSTMRMVDEYHRRLYIPTARRSINLIKNNFEGISTLTGWKRSIEARFLTVQIDTIKVKGIEGNTIAANTPLEIEMTVNPGKLKKEELKAELIIGPDDGNGFSEKPQTIELEPLCSDESNLLTYRISHQLDFSGTFRYTLRVVPYHKLLACTQETGLVRWA
jgi:phosphorylase/glycogen(starch) synthase